MSWLIRKYFYLFIALCILITASVKIPFDLGSSFFPAPLYARYIIIYFILGGIATLLIGLIFLESQRPVHFFEKVSEVTELYWITLMVVLAVVAPVLIRFFILKNAPVVDDEFVYKFSAKLLAQGKLYGESQGILAPFFDHSFLYQGDKTYGYSTLGWPALMLPGLVLKIPGYINSLYNGLTIIPIYLLVKKTVGSLYARVISLVFITSPMIMIAAATSMSHTSCFMFLSWMVYFISETKVNSRKVNYFLSMMCFCIAFFIRPQAALPLAIPYLLFLLYQSFCSQRKLPIVAVTLIPAIFFGSLFLLINKVQTERYFTPASVMSMHYRTTQRIYRSTEKTKLPAIKLEFKNQILTTLAAIIRMNFSMFGWPISFIFLFFCGFDKYLWLPWSSLLTFYVMQSLGYDPGVDTFGPPHYFETILPVLLLSAYGMKNLFDKKNLGKRSLLVIFCFFTLLNLCFYTPKSMVAIYMIQKDVNFIKNFVSDSKIRDGIIFVPLKFPSSHFCFSYPTKHFVYWRTHYSTGYNDSVMFVNDLGLNMNKSLLDFYPGKAAYLLVGLESCHPILLRLQYSKMVSAPNFRVISYAA